MVITVTIVVLFTGYIADIVVKLFLMWFVALPHTEYPYVSLLTVS
jgi:hypothetical protein